MALPIAIGVILGRFLDSHFHTGTFWTLTLLGAGIGIAALEVAIAISRALRDSEHD